VGEGSVGLGHPMGVFFFLYGVAGAIVSIDQFQSDAVFHAHAAAGPGGLYEPHGGQVLLTLAFDLKRNLVIRAADPPGAGFKVRLDIVHGLIEDFQRILDFELIASLLHPVVNQSFGKLLFAVNHYSIYQLGNCDTLVQPIGLGWAD